MKKVLSLVLAFAMILGSFGFVFASNFPDVKDTDYYGEPVNVLTGFGVIAGYPDGTFQPAKVVTRAEMVTMIVAALNIPVKGGATTKRFTDVELNHWAAGYIDYGYSVGFCAGYPDGTFKPEKEVSYNEALTMIVAALGYTAEALPGQWPGNFVNKAQSLGVLDTCRTTGTAGAPRQDIACFLYDALTAGIGYVDKDGEWHQNAGGDTMMKRLGATEYTPTGMEKGDAFVVTGKEDTLINMNNYIGAYITAYANKDNEIVAVKEVKSEFVEDSLNAKKTKVGDYKIDETEYLGKKTTDKDTDTFKGFLNGEVVTGIKDLTATELEGKTIKVAAKVSGTKLVKVYSVQVWDANEEFMADEDVQEVIEKDHKIGSIALPEDDNDAIDTKAFALVGVDALSEIKEGDVVTIYWNNDTDKDIKKIEVSDKTVEGAVTEINKDDEAVIGGTAYAISANADTTVPKVKELMDAEKEATFYLNYAGEIFDFKEADDSVSNYAVVLDTGKSKDDWDTSATELKVNLFLADETTKVFSVDSKAKVGDKDYPDGIEPGVLVKYTVSDDVITKFELESSHAGDAVVTAKGLFDGKEFNNSSIVFSYTGGTDKTEKADAKNYEVLDAADIYDTTLTTLSYIASSGAMKAALVTGVQGESVNYAIFLEKTGTQSGDKVVYNALYEGKVQKLTLTKDAGTEAESAKYTTAESITFKAPIFNSSNVVKSFSTKTPASAAPVKAILVDDDGKTVKTTFDAAKNILKDAKNGYELVDGVAIYVLDGTDWAAGGTSDITGKAFKAIYLYDTSDKADKVYDVVIVVK